MENKKKSGGKKKCGRPTGFNFSHLLYRKQNFLYQKPYYVVCMFFVCRISPANYSELFPGCLNVILFALVLRHRGVIA